MAAKQTVMWTALPNGVGKAPDKTKTLRLSAIMSPRLTSNVTPLWLATFPDFVHWATTVESLGFSVQFKTKWGSVVTVPAQQLVRTSHAVPELWAKLFSETTPVKGYVAPDLSHLKVNSYKVKVAADALRGHIGALASRPDVIYKTPLPEEIINPSNFPNSPLTAHLGPQMQRVGIVRASSRVAAPVEGPTIHDEFTAFHAPYTVAHPWNRMTPGERAAKMAVERETDFHKAITALGNYPTLLPLLGIVVNFDVLLTGTLPAQLASAARVRVVPNWLGKPTTVERVDAYPWTAIELSGRAGRDTYYFSGFRAKPKDAELSEGYLVVRDTSTEDGSGDPIVLENIEVDMVLGRFFGTFDSIMNEMNARVNPQVAEAAKAGGADTPSAAGATDMAPLAALEAIKAGFPTLGQPTLALCVAQAGQRLANRLNSTAAKNAKLNEGKHTEIVHYAEELTRGYRVDVWDSVSKVWHTLCERQGTYVLGDPLTEAPLTWDGGATELIDEGWVQLAPTSPPDDDPQAPTEMRLHERLFAWEGWSLVVHRPGAALSERDPVPGEDPTNTMRPNAMMRTYVGPDGVSRDLGDWENDGLALRTRFRVPPATLPRLRLGTTYRFRARAVDLAGNSVSFSKGDPTDAPGGPDDKLTTVTRAITHKRYEAVKPPIVLIANEMRQGESPLHLVVASNYNTQPAGWQTARHLCPPRTSFTMAEAHGAFDLTTAGRPMDVGAYADIVAKDAYDLPHNPLPTDPVTPGDGKQQVVPEFNVPVPYLADVPSRGASLSGLPGTKAASGAVSYLQATNLGVLSSAAGISAAAGTGTVSHLTAEYASTVVQLSDGSSATSEALRIPFEVDATSGTERRPFKFVVQGVEGTDKRLAQHVTPASPAWDDVNRVLTVQLAKAEQVTVELSSFTNADDVNLFGTYQWGVTESLHELQPTLVPKLISPEALAPGVMTPKAIALPLLARSDLPVATNTLIDVSVLGNNWTMTPQEKLTLVHAVQQPMLKPDLTYAMQVRRSPGDTTAVLVDWVQIHGKSTSRVTMDAEWKEIIDDPKEGPPKWGSTAVPRKGRAFALDIGRLDTVALSLREAAPSGLTMPVTPVTRNNDPKAQRQSFGDTKHRYVKYSLRAEGRFQKYFPPEADTTRTGMYKWRHARSTARPHKPEVDIAVPAFEWVRSQSASGATSVRGGGRLRVYLKRPWFSSGDGEKLAVVLWQTGNNEASFEKIRKYVTEWGNDPVYRSKGSVPSSLPSSDNFEGYVRLKTNLFVPEYAQGEPLHVTIVAYPVEYDPETDRWFADITMKQGGAYFPFVKLALARYQEWSLTGLELSPTVTLDAVQLTPDRSAALTWSLVGKVNYFTVTVRGRSFEENASGYGPRMTMTLQNRAAGGLAWVDVTLPGQSAAEVDLQTYTPAYKVVGDTKTYWKKENVSTLGLSATGEYRLVMREYERFITGSTTSSGWPEVLSKAVYIEALPFVPPVI